MNEPPGPRGYKLETMSRSVSPTLGSSITATSLATLPVRPFSASSSPSSFYSRPHGRHDYLYAATRAPTATDSHLSRHTVRSIMNRPTMASEAQRISAMWAAEPVEVREAMHNAQQARRDAHPSASDSVANYNYSLDSPPSGEIVFEEPQPLDGAFTLDGSFPLDINPEFLAPPPQPARVAFVRIIITITFRSTDTVVILRARMPYRL